MQGCELFTPAVTRGFGLAQLEVVLKGAMQSAGVEGRQSTLLIEDHHITSDDILETINSLLSAGGLLWLVGPPVVSDFHLCTGTLLPGICTVFSRTAGTRSSRSAMPRILPLRAGLAGSRFGFLLHCSPAEYVTPQPPSKNPVKSCFQRRAMRLFAQRW